MPLSLWPTPPGPRAAAAILLCLVLSVMSIAATGACRRAAPPPDERAARPSPPPREGGPRFDEPDEAAEFFAAKRAPIEGDGPSAARAGAVRAAGERTAGATVANGAAATVAAAAAAAAGRAGIDVRRRYDAAMARLAGMPRFSSRVGRTLPAARASVPGSARAETVWFSRGVVVAGSAGAGTARQQAGAQTAGSGGDAARLADAWTPLGPGNIGGRSRALLVDPRDPRRLFAAGVSGGVWQSDDGGESWRPIGQEMANLAVNALAWHPQRAATIYAGTGEGYFREDVRGTALPLRGAGIYRSDDGGRSWHSLASTSTPDFHFVNDLIVGQTSDRRVYAATRSGVWRSEDAGGTWTQLLAPGVQGGCLDLEVRRDANGGSGGSNGTGDVLFASCGTFAQAAVYRFADASRDAPPVPVLRDPGMGRTSLAIAPSAPDVIYALAATNEDGQAGASRQGLHAVFRSAAGGAPGTWERRVSQADPLKTHRLLLHNPVSALLEECAFAGPNTFLPMGWYVNTIAVDPRDPDRVWVAGVDWFRSDDGGRTWGIVSHWWAPEDQPQYAHADQHAIAFHPAYDGERNQTLFIANDGGLFHTDNARAASARGLYGPCNPYNSSVAWRSLNHGYGVTQFYHGAPFPDGSRVLGGTQDNGTIAGSAIVTAAGAAGAAPGFDAWQRLFGGDGGYVAIDPQDPSIIYAETQWGQIRKSIDGGRTFAFATTGLEPARESNLDASSNYLFITPFVMDPASSQRLWTGGQFIYRTEDGAARWTRASEALHGALNGSPEAARDGAGRVSAIAVSPQDPQRVLVGASNGWVYRQDRALAADARTVWPSARPRAGWVTSVAFHPRDPRIAYATYGNFGGPHVFRSDDGGDTWRSLDGAGSEALPDIPVHVLVVDPADPDRLYLGTDLGVFVSATGGDRWMVENTGFGPIVTEWLSLLETRGRRWLFAFTHGRGAWRVDLP